MSATEFKTPKLKTMSAKFGAMISFRISIVKKDVSMYPYSATYLQVYKQVYGAKYANLLFKTTAYLIKDDELYYKIALENGCTFEEK